MSRDELRALAAPVAALVGARAGEFEIGRALIDLRGRVDGQWPAALRLIWPCVKNPRARAHEMMDGAREAAAAEVGGSEGIGDPSPALGMTGAAVGMTGAAVGMTSLGEKEQRRYPLVQGALGMRGAHRKAEIERIAADEGVSVGTVYRWLERVKGHGAAGLRRRRRADAGKTGVPDGARDMLLARRLHPRMSKERLSAAIKAVRERFPQASEAALRHLARSIPTAARMSRNEYAKRFYPTGEWRAPYPNHSWSFDYTIADVKCWDGDARVKPYRPWVTGIVDEATGSPMAVLYTRDHPDRHALRSVLLMGILPKAVRSSPEDSSVTALPQNDRPGAWPQHGLPERLHGDNGKVQRSEWLAGVCQQIGVNLDVNLDMAFSNAYESWQNGHIEEFWKDLHAMFEARFAEVGAYCGRSPAHKPEGYIGDNAHLSSWRKLPMLADLNRGAQAWIVGEYLTRHHTRLGMSRNDAWRLNAGGHVNLPDEAWLRQILMFQETRKVGRARVALNGFSYWHEALIDYEGLELPVWWDAAHLESVLVFDAQGRQVCRAEVERPQEIGDADSLREYKRKRDAVRRRRREFVAMADELGESLPPAKVADVVARLERRAAAPQAGLTTNLPLPGAQRLHAKTPERAAADEGLELLARRAGEAEQKTTDYADGADALELLPIIARGGQGAHPHQAEALTFHGIELGDVRADSNLPPASDASAAAGPEDDPNAHTLRQKAGPDFEPSPAPPPALPQSFDRWARDRYGPHGDMLRQPAVLRKAARKQLAENYAAPGIKRPADHSRGRLCHINEGVEGDGGRDADGV